MLPFCVTGPPSLCTLHGPVVDFFITKQTSLHPFDFVRNLFHLLVCTLFHVSKFYKYACMHVLTKTLPFKVIGVALRLLNSQWEMHHCDVLCLVLSSLCSIKQYFTVFCALNFYPRTLHEPHPHLQRTAT